MTPGYFESFSYCLFNLVNQPRPYRGVQMGYLAVRKCLHGETHHPFDSAPDVCSDDAWSVDHWPSGIIIQCAPSFDTAARIADEINIHCAATAAGGELDAKTPAELQGQLGRAVMDWLDALPVVGIVPFRQWQAKHRRSRAA